MIENICRLCCAYSAESNLIYALYQSVYNLIDIFFELTSLQLEISEHLPTTICTICAEKLVDFHLFRQQSIETQGKLLAIKDEPPTDEICWDDNILIVQVKDEENENGEQIQNGMPACELIDSDLQFDGPKPVEIRAKLEPKARKTRKTAKNVDASGDETATSDAVRKKREFICDKCGVAFLFPSRFIAHYRRSHLMQFERKICPYCPRAFTLSTTGTSNLGRHIRTAHQNQVKDKIKYPAIKCTDCDKVFCGSLEYYEHSKIHEKQVSERDDGYNLNCDTCHIDLETFDNFHLHMKEQHGITDRRDVKPVKCRWCGERCRNLLGLCTHIRIVHKFDGNAMETIPSYMINKTARGRSSTFLCMTCGKILRSSSSYNHHMDIHAGIKQFGCDICQAKFMTNASLITHRLVHTQERKQQCKECGKSFKQLGHLKTHLKSHGIGITEKFTCNVCHKDFTFRGVLKEHMWVHNKAEVKPYVCDDCGKGFVRRHKWQEHVKKEHSKNGR